MQFREETTMRSGSKVLIPLHFMHYKYDRVIGKGEYAVTIRMIDIISGKYVAGKCMDKRNPQNKPAVTKFRNEISAMKELAHPNIVSVFDVFENEESVIMVMEYCCNGELYDYISQKRRINDVEVMSKAQQILSALSYIHSKGYAHRDLKPENIVLDANNNPKIIDFGLSCSSNSLTKTMCGSPFYVAPEIMSHNEYDGKLADMWSFGVLIHIMSTGYLPWTETNHQMFIKKLIKKENCMKLQFCGQAMPLVLRTLIVDPSQRASADDLLDYIQEGFVVSHVKISKVTTEPCQITPILGKISCIKKRKNQILKPGIKESKSLPISMMK